MGVNTSTNLGLQTIIIEGITPNDRINAQGAAVANASILERSMAGIQTAANAGLSASVINTGGAKIVQLQITSAGSIGSITGMYVGVPFVLLVQSGTSMGIPDSGAFKLSAAWIPSSDDTLTLVWDGTNFFEIGRSTN